MNISREKFFTAPDGRSAELIKLRSADGSGVDITNFGGCVVSLMVPDKNGSLTDVALGWKKPEDYLTNGCYFGALIGRIPNRIANGRFTFEGRVYQMCLNDNNRCTLHGGFGFSHRWWDIESISGNEVTLRLISPDGDGGFPGKIEVHAVYRWKEDHTLELEISAESDRPAVADFTNHTYFNLDGENYGSTLDHTVKIAADRVTVTDEFLQATGEILDVAGSRFDLRSGKSFRQIISENPSGFDDNFIIGDAYGVFRKNAAVVTAGHSGISMAVHTTAPGIQFYMGGFLNEDGKSRYLKHSGFCLETQNWPNAVNMPCFPSVRIEPGKGYHSISCYAFSTGKDIQ